MSLTMMEIRSTDRRSLAKVDALLQQEGIRRDGHLDYTCGLFDDDMNLCATGSCFANTLRCMAVASSHQGEGLLNEIVTHLCEHQAEKGNLRLFVYTKVNTAKFFGDLGFHEIVRVPEKLVFMENRRGGFESWLGSQKKGTSAPEKTAAIVMNANPFTKGHRWLVEQACARYETVHLFVLSENYGPIPASVRYRLVAEGTADLPGVILHESGPYIISSATFPSYFLKDGDDVIRTHAAMDIRVFGRIAQALGIGCRLVGEEPFSHTTSLYNEVMQTELPALGVACTVLPRLTDGEIAISASRVRQAIHDGALESVRASLPETTYRFFASAEGAPVVARLKAASELIHH